MIQRLYIEDYLNFDKVNIKLQNNLVVFSGVSGSGKSVLLNAILGVLGYTNVDAKKIEIETTNHLNLEEYGISSQDTNIFSALKTKTQRFFINSQAISKKNINQISTNFITYLSVKNSNEFENSRLLTLLDRLINDKKHNQNLEELSTKFKNLSKQKLILEDIEQKENKVEELKEFLEFEITKIESINPKEGELEELLEVKKSLSKKEKVLKLITKINNIFEYESDIIELYQLNNTQYTDIENSLNDLKINISDIEAKYENLDDNEIENILNRIEKLSYLEKKYGSISEALEQKNKKQKELELYTNIELEKKSILKSIKILMIEIQNLTDNITQTRKSTIPKLQSKLNNLTNALFVGNTTLTIHSADLSDLGTDRLQITLNNTTLEHLSSGEYNRLRLSLLVVYADIMNLTNGILILDEVDANLSGKESQAIANVLHTLSSHYQILAISHQPQLSAKASQHFVIEKNNNKSYVKELTPNERIEEIARMVSGENITNEALQLASKLMNN